MQGNSSVFPDFNGWFCYPVFMFIGIVTQINLVQKSGEISIVFWKFSSGINSKDSEWKCKL